MTKPRQPDKCRAVIVHKEGTHEMPWVAWKSFDALGPDEMPPMSRAIEVARRYAVRRGWDVKGINGEYHYPGQKH